MPFLFSKHCSDFTGKGKDLYICLQGHRGSRLLCLPLWHHHLLYSLLLLPSTTWMTYSSWKTPPCSHLRAFALAGPSVSTWLSLLFLSLFQNDSILNIHMAHSFHSIGSSVKYYFLWQVPFILYLKITIALPTLFPALCFLYNHHLTYILHF